MARKKKDTGAEEAEKASADAGASPQDGAKSAPAAEATAAAEAALVVVQGPREGRWRAGRHFGRDPVEIPLEDLSEVEHQQLLDDPALAVTTVPAPQE